MKNYTMEYLDSLELKEVRKIAKNEFNLPLSDGGKRLKKGQLIVNIASTYVNYELKKESERK